MNEWTRFIVFMSHIMLSQNRDRLGAHALSFVAAHVDTNQDATRLVFDLFVVHKGQGFH
jgi:hypothetical protein